MAKNKATIDMDDLKRLIKNVSSRKPESGLYMIIDCAEPSRREETLKRVNQELSAIKIDDEHIHTINLGPQHSIDSFFDHLKNFSEPTGQVRILHIVEEGDWFRQTERVEDDYRGLPLYDAARINFLNKSRETIFNVPILKMFWLTPESIEVMAKVSIDFFAWRGGIYRIPPEDPVANRPEKTVSDHIPPEKPAL